MDKIGQKKNLKVFNFTLGIIEKGMATLTDQNYNVIHLPAFMLPETVRLGGMVTLTLQHNKSQQQERISRLKQIQQKILNQKSFFKNLK